MLETDELERMANGMLNDSVEIREMIQSNFDLIKENERLKGRLKVRDQAINKMDGHLVRCGSDIMKAEDKRADLQWKIDPLREALEEIRELSKHDNESRDLDKCYVVALRALKQSK